MFIELTILYPFKSTYKKIIHLLESQKKELDLSNKCIEYSIYKDTYSDKIFYMIKWESKEIMRNVIDEKKHKKIVEEMLNLQKFPGEVYRLEKT